MPFLVWVNGRQLWACPFKATYHRRREDARRGRRVVTTALREAARHRDYIRGL